MPGRKRKASGLYTMVEQEDDNRLSLFPDEWGGQEGYQDTKALRELVLEFKDLNDELGSTIATVENDRLAEIEFSKELQAKEKLFQEKGKKNKNPLLNETPEDFFKRKGMVVDKATTNMLRAGQIVQALLEHNVDYSKLERALSVKGIKVHENDVTLSKVYKDPMREAVENSDVLFQIHKVVQGEFIGRIREKVEPEIDYDGVPELFEETEDEDIDYTGVKELFEEDDEEEIYASADSALEGFDRSELPVDYTGIPEMFEEEEFGDLPETPDMEDDESITEELPEIPRDSERGAYQEDRQEIQEEETQEI